MDRPWSIFGKLKLLFDESGLLPAQFVNLCAAHGIETSQATISRALKAGRFTSHEFSESLRPLVLALEDLVERTIPLRISFENTRHIKDILELISHGVDLRVGEPISIQSAVSVNDSSQINPA